MNQPNSSSPERDPRGRKIITVNMDGPCPPPPGKPNPQPIPQGGHSLIPGKSADASLAPIPLTNPDPRCVEKPPTRPAEPKLFQPPPLSKLGGGSPAAKNLPIEPEPEVPAEDMPSEEAKALKEELHKLGPEELQAFMEIIQRHIKQKRKQFDLPQLPITEEDKDIVSDRLASGQPYAEEFVRARGKLVVVFRDPVGDETEIIFAQLRQDGRDGLITEPIDSLNRLNRYNLLVQTMAINGVDQPRAIPPLEQRPVDFSLRAVLENSIFGRMSSPRIYLLLSILSQFDEKVRRIVNEIISDQGF